MGSVGLKYAHVCTHYVKQSFGGVRIRDVFW